MALQDQDIGGLLQNIRISVATSIANFDANAILRGAQLTIVGALRALGNPKLFKYEHYRQAALAVFAGIFIRFLIFAPISLLRFSLWLLSFILDLESSTWDDAVFEGLDFIAKQVLQLPFFLMSLMRYVTPTLDHLLVFMDSLNWVDQTYVLKHKSEDPSALRALYYPNLSMYSTHGDTTERKSPTNAAMSFLLRFSRRAGFSLAIFSLSYMPLVGRLILPMASFYTFNKAVGPVPATMIFSTGIFLPRRYLVVFLQSYFASRSLMRELLEPYFSRIRFNKDQKRKFFRDREGVLFGFAIGFYLFLQIPLLGILIYGIAEASTAYLITKITDSPPPPLHSENFAESQIKWTNKHDFLRRPLSELDVHKISSDVPRKFVSANYGDLSSTKIN